MLDEKYILYLANKCIEKYCIGESEISFIRQNENITLMVIDKSCGDKYLLRIHGPINLNYYGIQHTYEGLESEKSLLMALNSGTDLILQRPVLNTNGGFVSTINDCDRNKTILCTLLSWVEGEKFTSDIDNASELAFKYGIVLAKLHDFSTRWKVPDSYVRPVYDAGKYICMVDRLDFGVEKGLYKREDLNNIINCMRYIKVVYESVGTLPGKWGIIHADTHTGNIIIHNKEEVAPIDFSFSGYGYYALDLGVALSSLKLHLRKPLLEGYKTLRNLDDTDMKLISASYVLGILGAFAFCINNVDDHDWLRRRVPEIANKECKMLIEGENFIFPEY